MTAKTLILRIAKADREEARWRKRAAELRYPALREDAFRWAEQAAARRETLKARLFKLQIGGRTAP